MGTFKDYYKKQLNEEIKPLTESVDFQYNKKTDDGRLSQLEKDLKLVDGLTIGKKCKFNFTVSRIFGSGNIYKGSSNNNLIDYSYTIECESSIARNMRFIIEVVSKAMEDCIIFVSSGGNTILDFKISEKAESPRYIVGLVDKKIFEN